MIGRSNFREKITGNLDFGWIEFEKSNVVKSSFTTTSSNEKILRDMKIPVV